MYVLTVALHRVIYSCILLQMGFTEAGHPNMASTIRAHVPERGDVSKEVEDNIVTTFIEELEEAPLDEQPRASASTSKW